MELPVVAHAVSSELGNTETGRQLHATQQPSCLSFEHSDNTGLSRYNRQLHAKQQLSGHSNHPVSVLPNNTGLQHACITATIQSQ